MRRDVFQGIADPTRREILTMIARKSLNVNAVAGNFPVRRTAIYKHMKILTECGLVVVKQQGRERYCTAQLKKLNKVTAWVERYRKIWELRFDTLEELLKKTAPKKRTENKRLTRNKISKAVQH